MNISLIGRTQREEHEDRQSDAGGAHRRHGGAVRRFGNVSCRFGQRAEPGRRKGRTLNIQQWDTFLNGVFPLDRNRLTRVKGSTRARRSTRSPATVPGLRRHAGAGLSIGFPWSLGGHQLLHTTPNVALDAQDVVDHRHRLLPPISTPPLLPGASISANLGNGPGIRRSRRSRSTSKGPNGAVAVSNAHGTVTERPVVCCCGLCPLISSDGDSVTYGEPLEHELTSAPTANCPRRVGAVCWGG